MNTREDEVAAQKRLDDEAARARKMRDDDAAREQQIRDQALIADLSHAKDKAEEERLKKRHADETAAAKAQRDEADRSAR